MRDLFDVGGGGEPTKGKSPLADRMRPRSLEEFVGQKHILGEGKLLRKLIETDSLGSLILWGPPGSGKTTLGKVIAGATRARFVFFSAILSGVKEIREIVREAEEEWKYRKARTLLFVDEIHRFSKSQQDAFLPYVESGLLTVVGATTENPSFEVIAPLLSRCTVLTLFPLARDELQEILSRALVDQARGLGRGRLSIAPEALAFIAEHSAGDARVALNTLETASHLAGEHPIDLVTAREALQKKPLLYDKGGEEHYNVISAFIKSLRGSDPDGALYWLARMLEGGEDPIFIIRRMVIMASEDIGNADPRGLQMALAALQGFQLVGMPEGRIILAQAVVYLATAPKSNASYVGIDAALAEVRHSGPLPVPLHVRNAPTKLMKELGYGKGYKYAHSFTGGYVPQDYLPEALAGKQFYKPTKHGYEKSIGERMELLKRPPAEGDEG